MPDDHSRDQCVANRTTNANAQIANAAEQDDRQEVHVCDQSIGRTILWDGRLGV